MKFQEYLQRTIDVSTIEKNVLVKFQTFNASRQVTRNIGFFSTGFDIEWDSLKSKFSTIHPLQEVK